MLNRDFSEFVAALDANRVDYLVVGGHALAAYGHPRYTGDIDFWLRTTPDNLQRLLQALRDFGFGPLAIQPGDFDAGGMVQLGFPPHRIDLLGSIDGVDFDDCWPRREVVHSDGLALNLIGRDDFKANKRAAGRPQDLADLDRLDSA